MPPKRSRRTRGGGRGKKGKKVATSVMMVNAESAATASDSTDPTEAKGKGGRRGGGVNKKDSDQNLPTVMLTRRRAQEQVASGMESDNVNVTPWIQLPDAASSLDVNRTPSLPDLSAELPLLAVGNWEDSSVVSGESGEPPVLLPEVNVKMSTVTKKKRGRASRGKKRRSVKGTVKIQENLGMVEDVEEAPTSSDQNEECMDVAQNTEELSASVVAVSPDIISGVELMIPMTLPLRRSGEVTLAEPNATQLADQVKPEEDMNVAMKRGRYSRKKSKGNKSKGKKSTGNDVVNAGPKTPRAKAKDWKSYAPPVGTRTSNRIQAIKLKQIVTEEAQNTEEVSASVVATTTSAEPVATSPIPGTSAGIWSKAPTRQLKRTALKSEENVIDTPPAKKPSQGLNVMVAAPPFSSQNPIEEPGEEVEYKGTYCLKNLNDPEVIQKIADLYWHEMHFLAKGVAVYVRLLENDAEANNKKTFVFTTGKNQVVGSVVSFSPIGETTVISSDGSPPIFKFRIVDAEAAQNHNVTLKNLRLGAVKAFDTPLEVRPPPNPFMERLPKFIEDLKRKFDAIVRENEEKYGRKDNSSVFMVRAAEPIPGEPVAGPSNYAGGFRPPVRDLGEDVTSNMPDSSGDSE